MPIIQSFKPVLVGQNPLNVDYLFESLRTQDIFAGAQAGQYVTALSGVEIGLWDLAGKTRGLPIYQLLGGKVRDRIRVYCDMSTPTPLDGQGQERIQQVKDLRFTVAKTDSDDYNDPGRWDKVNWTASNGEIENMVKKVAFARKSLDEHVDLAVDMHGRYDMTTGNRVAKELEPFKLLWLEEAVPPEADGLERHSPSTENTVNFKSIRRVWHLICETLSPPSRRAAFLKRWLTTVHERFFVTASRWEIDLARVRCYGSRGWRIRACQSDLPMATEMLALSPRFIVSPAKGGIAAISLVFILLLSALPMVCQQTVTLAGQVQGVGGTVIHSVVNLRLESTEGVLVEHQPARTDGQFEFGSLRKERYRLTVTADGYQPFQQDVDLGFTAGTVFLNVFLTPAGKKATQKSALPALTDDSAPKKARKEFQKGARALAENRTAEARAHFEKAVAEYPCYARAQSSLALSLVLLREFSRAENALKKSLECDPGFHEAHLVYGQLLNLQQRFAEAEKMLLQGVRLAPGTWQFYYQLGIARFGLGKYDKAEEAFLRVQSLNPDPPPEWYVKVADFYLKVDSYAKAYETMQAYLRAEPDGRFAGKIRKIMGEMEAAGVLHENQSQPASTPFPPQ